MSDRDSSGGPPGGEDRRSSPRKRAFIGGIVTSLSGSMTWECSIKNRSEEGVQILLKEAQVIPDNCVLINLLEAVAYEATVEWAQPLKFGLKLLQAHKFQGTIDPKMNFAKKLWLAHRGLAEDLG
jgi:hypothetical protein